jgi:hypothetical protein
MRRMCGVMTSRFRIKRHVTHETHQSRATASAHPSVIMEPVHSQCCDSCSLGICNPERLHPFRFMIRIIRFMSLIQVVSEVTLQLRYMRLLLGGK